MADADFDIDLGEEIFDEDFDNLEFDSPKNQKHDDIDAALAAEITTTTTTTTTTKKTTSNNGNVVVTEEKTVTEEYALGEDRIEEDFTPLESKPNVRATSSGAVGIAPLPPMKNNADIAETSSQSEFDPKKQQFERGEGFEYQASPMPQPKKTHSPASRSPASRSPRSRASRSPGSRSRASRSPGSKSVGSHRSHSERSSVNSLGSNPDETIRQLTETNQRLRDQLVKLSRTLDYHLQQKGIRMRKRSAHKPADGGELKNAHRQIKMYRKANADLKNKLYSSENVEKITSLKNQLLESKKKIKALNSEIRSLNNIQREQSKRLEVLDNGNTDIIQKNENAIRVQKAEARKYRDQNKKYMEQVTKLRRQIMRVRGENDRYRDLMSKHDLTVDAAGEIEQLRKELEDEKKAKEEALRKASISAKAIDSLKRRQQLEAKKYKSEKAKLTGAINELENRIAHHRYRPSSTTAAAAADSSAATPASKAPGTFESRLPKPTPSYRAGRRNSSVAAAPSKRRGSVANKSPKKKPIRRKKAAAAAGSKKPVGGKKSPRFASKIPGPPKKSAPKKSVPEKKAAAKKVQPKEDAPPKEEAPVVKEEKSTEVEEKPVDELVDDVVEDDPILDDADLNFDDEGLDVDVDIDGLLDEAADVEANLDLDLDITEDTAQEVTTTTETTTETTTAAIVEEEETFDPYKPF